MRVIVTKENSDDMTYESLEIIIDDTYKFSVHHSDDTPEDNNLNRNFSDCYDIPNMLQRAYLAGKNGEEFNIELGDEEL